MKSHPAKIVRADETDADAITTILSTGFQNDPVCRWLFPDDDARERLHPEFFGPIVQMALEDGALNDEKLYPRLDLSDVLTEWDAVQ